MPRTAEQNQNIKDRRRSKLLSFALKAYAANGYDHTAIDDITKPAKCSHGLFYHYFDSKEAVFAALIDEVLTKEAELPTERALEVGGAAGLRVLTDYAESLSHGGAKDIAVARVTVFLSEASNLDSYGKKFAASHNLKSTIATLVKQGQAEGKVVAGDPGEISQAAEDMAKGALIRLGAKGATGIVSSDVLLGLLLKGPIAY